MQTISEVTVNLALSYPKLINALQRAFTENIINLPIHPFMTIGEVTYMCDVINNYV